jgi:hypothetical protein
MLVIYANIFQDWVSPFLHHLMEFLAGNYLHLEKSGTIIKSNMNVTF